MLPILLAVIFLTRQCLSSSFEMTLRSPQYILISQYKCGTVFETGLEENRCPLGLTPHNKEKDFRKFDCEMYMRANLVRDPSQTHPPKVLYLGADSTRQLAVVIDNVNMAANGSHQVEHRRMRFSNGAETIKLDISYPLAINDVKAALYDSDSQLLYLLIKKWYKGDSANHCLVFYIRNVFGAAGNPVIERLTEFGIHSHNFFRYDWNIDPYTQKVHYSVAHGEGTSLYGFPADQLMPILREGGVGKLIYTFIHGKRSHLRAMDNILFSSATEDDMQFSKIRNLKHLEEKGMVCHYTENITDFHDPVAISTLLVKDNDYCLVRDGRTADLDKCAEERKEWRAANNLQIPSDKVGESSAWCTVLFVVTLVLSFLLVTSCFCMCWMKRNLDSSFIEEPPRTVPYYAGRPGQYPEDVSVDKWNSHY